jgi:deazaflavin-dependent oxidoreductase (nitroreductase family)
LCLAHCHATKHCLIVREEQRRQWRRARLLREQRAQVEERSFPCKADSRLSSTAASVPAAYLLDLIGMRLIDRVARAAVRVGLGRRSTALIETTGRRSGKSRVTPVTNGLDGDVFWIVTEHGHKANYVRNIEANPRVRVNAGRGWRTGTARIVDDDPEARLAQIVALNPRARANADIVRNTGTENLVIRIDLAE